jgi:hypothetical protein
MRAYGFAAVRSSLAALRQSVGDKGIGFRLAKLFFRAVNVTPAAQAAGVREFRRGLIQEARARASRKP